MSQFVVQFHAVRAEILSWVSGWLESGLFVVAESFPPFGLDLLERGALERAMDNPSVGRLSFFEAKPTLSAPEGIQLDQLAYYRENPVRMTLSIGRLTPMGLAESSLGAINPIPRWRACANDIKKATKSGAAVVSPRTPTVGWLPSHRYTEGARALFVSGVPILTLSPNATLRLESKPSKKSQ